MAPKRKLELTPCTGAPESDAAQMLPPSATLVEDKVAFLKVPKLTTLEVAALGADPGSMFTQAKFLPGARRVRVLEAYDAFALRYDTYRDECARLGHNITYLDGQLGRDTFWVDKVVRHIIAHTGGAVAGQVGDRFT